LSATVKLPHLNANEDQAVLTRWAIENGQHARKGETLCVVETTKTAMDVDAPADGFVHQIAREGARIATGSVIAVLLDSAGQDPAEVLAREQAPVAPSDRRWTKKAEMVAAKLGVDLEALCARKPGVALTEADVVGASKTARDATDLVDERHTEGRRERVLLVGGGGGGGVITLDCIYRTLTQRAVGILDNNPATHGKRVMGTPVLGPTTLIDELWEKKQFDAAIVVVTSTVDERRKIFDSLVRKAIKVTNVVDPSVTIRANVKLGVGNLIMPGCFIASCATLGDNNFLASGTLVEHHSVIGDHCTFGPRCALSGAVTVGSRVKFGMGVLVEPYLSIGDDSLLPSGVVLTQDVPERSTVKVNRSYVIRERD
jgi:sugar O-acyltransferase (sialic acid O-acetyltransferase NeuD family)